MQIVILAGGSGKRLWPLSNENMPKQFLKLSQLENKSLFQITMERAIKITNLKNIYIVVSNPLQRNIIIAQLKEIKINYPFKQIILGPNKDTLGGIIFGLSYCKDYTLILPTDHIIKNEDEFFAAIPKAKKMAKSSLVLFGIKPNKAHTGYGYIKPKPENITEVDKFVEKPDKTAAQEYILENYYWNSGIFFFRKGIFFEELKKENPKIYNFYFNSEIKKIFTDAPEISVDHALLEKSKNLKLMILNLEWMDIGNFDAITEFNQVNEEDNVGTLETFFFNSKNNLIQDRENKQIILSEVDDLIVINTKHTLLITKKGKSENMKEIVKKLEKVKKEDNLSKKINNK